MRDPSDEHPRWTWLLAGTLLVAFGLRVELARRGGQGYWPDEGRYDVGRQAWALFASGHLREGWALLIGTAEHPLFKVAALLPAWLDAHAGPSPARAAAFFGLFSTGGLGLLGWCARRTGASRREAWLAVLFAACASSLFYYSRHLLPYDFSLCLCLAALAVGLGRASVPRSFAAGLLAGAAFLAYAAYWLVGGVVLIWHVLRADSIRDGFRRAVPAAAGLLLPLAGIVAAAHAAGADWLGSFRSFSGTVNQGDFGRGHVFVWQYLWDAEGPLLLLWLGASGYAVAAALRRRAWNRGLAPLGAAALLYLALSLLADVTRTFVVHGRNVRELAPFFTLALAWAAGDVWARRRAGPWMAGAAVAVGVCTAALHFAQPLGQVFPEQFLVRIRPLLDRPHEGLLRLMNASRLPDAHPMVEDRPYRTRAEARHPLQFLPYQYEGYNEAARARLNGADCTQRLLELPGVPVVPPPAGVRFAGRLTLRLPVGRDLFSEPLVAFPGKDAPGCLFVRYADGGHLRIGYDCGGAGGPVSELVPVDFAAEHELTVYLTTSGPWVAGAAAEPASPRIPAFLYLGLDGETLIAQGVEVPREAAGLAQIGMNLAGSGAASESFTGAVLATAGFGSAELAKHLPAIEPARLRPDPAWAGRPGPLHLSLRVATTHATGVEPLVIVTAGEVRESLVLVHSEPGKVRFAFRRTEGLSLETEPVELGPDGAVELDFSLGELFPADHRIPDTPDGEGVRLRRWLGLRVNGRTLLARELSPLTQGSVSLELLRNRARAAGAAEVFSGRVLGVNPLPLPEVLRWRRGEAGQAGAETQSLDGRRGPLALRLQFPQPFPSIPEPLFESGSPGAGDLIYVVYRAPGRIQIGIDHWGSGGPVSNEIEIPDPGKPHRLEVSTGVLYPGPDSPVFAAHPEWSVLRDRVLVLLDGRPVLNVALRTHPAPPERITLGENTNRASTAADRFTGRILETEPVDPGTLLKWVH